MSNSTTENKKSPTQQNNSTNWAVATAIPAGPTILVAPVDDVGVHAEEAPQQQELSPEREKNIKRRAGFDYFLATIEFKKGTKFGLGIKHYRNMVVVSKVDDGSMCSEALGVFDHICDVDGNPVTDKDVTKTLLVKSLQKNHKVSLLVARPNCQEAGEQMEQALNAAEEKPPSLTVAADVRDIMRRFQAKLMAKEKKPKSIMTSSKNSKSKKNVSFTKEDGRDHKSMFIMTDISCIEKLQKVKKPEPPTPPPERSSHSAPQESPLAMIAPAQDNVMGQPATPDRKKSTKSPHERSSVSSNSKNKKSEGPKAIRK